MHSPAPWNKPLSERAGSLFKHPSKKKAIYLYECADTSTFRYRVYNIAQALSSSDKWHASYFFSDELEYMDAFLAVADLVVIARYRWSFELAAFISRAKKLKIPIAFDVDDLVFDTSKLPLLMNSLGVENTEERLSYWFSYVSRLELTAELCDATIGTNNFLCKRLQDKFAKPSLMIPNFLNKEQLAYSETVYASKKKPPRFTLGYFSGTPSHMHDFAKAVPEIAAFLETYPQAALQVVGFIKFPEQLEPFVRSKQVYHTPFVDFLTLQEKIAAVDVNIVPLVNNEFTNCKSELKFFEAAVVGTVTCATPVHVFKSSIEQGKTGYLCDEGTWFTHLQTIYEGRMDNNLVAKAKEYCIDNYAYFNQTEVIENVFTRIPTLTTSSTDF